MALNLSRNAIKMRNPAPSSCQRKPESSGISNLFFTGPLVGTRGEGVNRLKLSASQGGSVNDFSQGSIVARRGAAVQSFHEGFHATQRAFLNLFVRLF